MRVVVGPGAVTGVMVNPRATEFTVAHQTTKREKNVKKGTIM